MTSDFSRQIDSLVTMVSDKFMTLGFPSKVEVEFEIEDAAGNRKTRKLTFGIPLGITGNVNSIKNIVKELIIDVKLFDPKTKFGTEYSMLSILMEDEGIHLIEKRFIGQKKFKSMDEGVAKAWIKATGLEDKRDVLESVQRSRSEPEAKILDNTKLIDLCDANIERLNIEIGKIRKNKKKSKLSPQDQTRVKRREKQIKNNELKKAELLSKSQE